MADIDRAEIRAVALETVSAAFGALGAVGALSPRLAPEQEALRGPSAREREAMTRGLASLEAQEHLTVKIYGVAHRIFGADHQFILMDLPRFAGRWWSVEFPPNDKALIAEFQRVEDLLRHPTQRHDPDEYFETWTKAVIRPLPDPPAHPWHDTSACEVVMLVTEIYR